MSEEYQIYREDAERLAKAVFNGVVDKAGAPYIDHCVYVATESERLAILNEMDGDAAYVVGMLHDVLEDTEFSYGMITRLFNRFIADSVTRLSKRIGQSKADYLEQVARHNLTALVKSVDSEHNSQLIRFKSNERATKKSACDMYRKQSKALRDTCRIKS